MPPSIPGLGSVGGFSIWLQDRSGGTIEALEQTCRSFSPQRGKGPSWPV
jgi:hypothetical protein